MRVFAIIAVISMVTSANAQTPDCRDVQFLLDRVWKKEQGSVEWKATLDSAMNICPTNARLWGDKAMGYMLRGEIIEGMAFLEKAVEFDPYYFLGSRAWYRVHYLHDYEGAIADLDALEKLAGSSFVYVINMHMYIMKGLAYQQLGNREKALELYTIAIDDQIKKSGPNWVGTFDYLHRGIVKYYLGDMDGAIDDLTREVKEYESLADTYYYRGLAYSAVGRKDEARLDLQHCKDLILGDGQRRWAGPFVLPDEVFLSDVDKALLRLY